MIDNTDRRGLALEILGQFMERNHACIELHLRAREFLSAGQFDPAVKCCAESYHIGLGMGDSYVRAASRLHEGLIIFACKDARHWERAADYCEESAALFRAQGERSAESVAWWAVGKIADAHTAEGYDQTQRALPAYLRLLAPDANTPEALEAHANAAYLEAVQNIGKLPPQITPAPGTPPTAPPLSPSASAAAPQTQPAPSPPSPGAPRQRVAVPAEPSFSAMQLFVVAVLTLDVIVVFALAAIHAFTLYRELPALRPVLLLLAALVLVATAVPFAILWGNGQLLFRLSGRQGALLMHRGNWIVEERAGVHFVIPFVESLVVLLPLGRRRLIDQVFEINASDGAGFLIIANTMYRVTEPVTVWLQIRQDLPPVQLAGIRSVVAPKSTIPYLDQHAKAILGEALAALVELPARATDFQESANLNRAALAQTGLLSSSGGLRFYEIDLRLYERRLP